MTNEQKEVAWDTFSKDRKMRQRLDNCMISVDQLKRDIIDLGENIPTERNQEAWEAVMKLLDKHNLTYNPDLNGTLYDYLDTVLYDYRIRDGEVTYHKTLLNKSHSDQAKLVAENELLKLENKNITIKDVLKRKFRKNGK